MIVKKLAVPFINDKLLQQAEHCYIATAAISETGFDFMRSRMQPRCKVEIVTGLDVPTSPALLRKIWRHLHERVTLRIYTRNFFHANVYIFDLPFRKSVAFIGSGHFTLEGMKDGEELFYKITDPKEIENLKSWFTGYYEFSEPLTEELILEYEWLYPTLKQRDIVSRQEKKQFMVLTTAGFSWDQIKFKYQFFKKEDYLTLSSSKAPFTTPELQVEREAVQRKLVELHQLIKKDVSRLKWFEHQDADQLVSSLDPKHHPDKKLRSLWITYGSGEAGRKNLAPAMTPADCMTLQIILQQSALGVWLTSGPQMGKGDREYFKTQMNEGEYRKQFFTLLTGLGAGYWIEIVGERKATDSFQNEDSLWEFTKADAWMHYTFSIEKNFRPGDAEISTENIAPTLVKEMEKLAVLFRLMGVGVES